MPPPPDARPPFPHDWSAANVRAGIEQSLRRLDTDHLDLVQVHMSPSRAQIEAEQTIETLLAMRDEGKTRFIGMSGILPNLPDHIAMGVFDVFQIPYSVVQREHEDLITAAAESGAGTLIRGGVARGGPAEDKNWAQGPLGLPQGEGQRRWDSADMDDLLGGMPRHEFVLRFTLSHPDLSSTIVGTSNLEHLRANLAIAAKGPLPGRPVRTGQEAAELTGQPVSGGPRRRPARCCPAARSRCGRAARVTPGGCARSWPSRRCPAGGGTRLRSRRYRPACAGSTTVC